MNAPNWLCRIILLEAICIPAFATVAITSLKPSLKSPQAIGAVIVWSVKATDTNPGPLTFQFNVTAPGGTAVMVKDFNVGSLKTGVWTAQPFDWALTGIQGKYKVEVVIKDFASGETATKTATYQVNPASTGGVPVALATANPLVALFSAPSCAAGDMMRVSFQPQSGSVAAGNTNWVNCNPHSTTTFEIAGVYPSTAYQMFSQTQTSSGIVNGPIVNFTTGALPAKVPFPAIAAVVPVGPMTDTTNSLILRSLILSGNKLYPPLASDLSGNINWYYSAAGSGKNVLTRPLPGGGILVFENGVAWNPAATSSQLLRQVDLAGNIVKETNTGILQQLLVNMGAVDAQACDSIPKPAPVGAACLGAFSHDAIMTLPNGYSAVQADIEKIFPAGTQGDTSGLPVDIVGDIIIVLDQNWQPVWYFDSFDHADGAPQLDITRAAILNESCTSDTGCPFTYLLGTGISPVAHDWLHGNSLYYSPVDGDLIWSSRNQDWVMKVDYNNGTGTGNILWRMGLGGDFTFNNINSDPYPWFSAQHEVGMENNGAGPMTVFDNGNTRRSPPPLGLGSGCVPSDCNSRGMALTVDEVNMTVTPVMSVDLGVFSLVYGSAQLLASGNYFFAPGDVSNTYSYDIQVLPTAGTIKGSRVLVLRTTQGYRAWEMPDLYTPPTT